MKRVRWPDGSESSADTWQQLLEQVRSEQWRQFGQWRFRLALRRRALNWSGIRIPLTSVLSANRFARALAAADLYEITEDNGHER